MNEQDGYVNTDVDEKGIATITFFHPAQNSMPGYLLNNLANTLINSDKNKSIKVIILKAGGDHAFCAGASFNELLQINTQSEATAFFYGFAKVINACRLCSKIIIGRVNGKAIGGGVGIAAATDYCFATEKAAVKLSELTIGIGPFVIEPAVTRKIGVSAFSQLAINATQFYSAQWASQQGLYAEVFNDDATMDHHLHQLTSQLSNYSNEALISLKRVMWSGTENWDTLLPQRAEISGQLVLQPAAQQAISKIKSR
jgi:methylglutaconyl-CoA hydratase